MGESTVADVARAAARMVDPDDAADFDLVATAYERTPWAADAAIDAVDRPTAASPVVGGMTPSALAIAVGDKVAREQLGRANGARPRRRWWLGRRTSLRAPAVPLPELEIPGLRERARVLSLTLGADDGLATRMSDALAASWPRTSKA